VVRIALMILASILVGFAAGRRLGLIQGFQQGMAYSLLDARRRSLEDGICPICASQGLLAGGGFGQDAGSTGLGDPHDFSQEAPGQKGTATGEAGEFGTMAAGCYRPVLNLHRGAYSIYWEIYH